MSGPKNPGVGTFQARWKDPSKAPILMDGDYLCMLASEGCAVMEAFHSYQAGAASTLDVTYKGVVEVENSPETRRFTDELTPEDARRADYRVPAARAVVPIHNRAIAATPKAVPIDRVQPLASGNSTDMTVIPALPVQQDRGQAGNAKKSFLSRLGDGLGEILLSGVQVVGQGAIQSLLASAPGPRSAFGIGAAASSLPLLEMAPETAMLALI